MYTLSTEEFTNAGGKIRPFSFWKGSRSLTPCKLMAIS